MEQDAILRRVQALLDRAEHPETPPEEADAARLKADEMMRKYAVDQAELDAARPAEKRQSPDTLKIDVSAAGSAVQDQLIDMATALAMHCRAKIVYHPHWSGRMSATVVGYPADLRYFEMLFAIVHMSSRIEPKADVVLSLDENVYNFHEAGMRWERIADLLNRADWSGYYGEGGYGNRNPATAHWRKAVRPSKNSPNLLIPWPDGHRLINAYKRHCKKINQAPHAIPNPARYQRSFATGYVRRLQDRLREMDRRGQTGSTALALRSESIGEMFAKMFPDITPYEDQHNDKRLDYKGFLAGDSAGSEVDLNGSKMGKSQAKPLG
jgi:hypothetical protein